MISKKRRLKAQQLTKAICNAGSAGKSTAVLRCNTAKSLICQFII